MPFGTIDVEWTALGHAAWVSFAAALVLVLTFTTGVVALAPREDAGDGSVPLTRRAAAVLVFALCASALAYGLWVTFTAK